ncbi:ATP-binding protein [Rossellomorea sp. BNER]|uniref:ATP-binding protein n=1 Tax=Rossellomorea sp. BNER TaxID=2962031 RepID=UPI003AF26B64|nr:ATP-binding protein [Rossellomorea sp. BNER]
MKNQSRRIAGRIALIYIIVGALWVVFSDHFSMILANDKLVLYVFFQRYKGWLFIVVTGVLIYFLIYWRTHRLLQSQQNLIQKEYQLQESKEHYQSLFNHNPDGVFELKRSGELVSLNPEGENIIGCSTEKLQGTLLEQFVVEEKRNEVREIFEDVIGGKGRKFEFGIINADGKKKTVRCTLLPIVVNQEINGVFGIARDITELRKNEEMMIRTEKLSLIGQLAAAVAHEIRNPLTSIKGFIQLLIATKKVEESHLDIILSEIDRIQIISGEMLVLGKKQAFNYKRESLREILKQVLVLMEAQSNLVNVKINYYDLSIDPPFVYGESNQLKSIFINIIQNAVEAIEREGHVSVSLYASGTDVIIEVEDNGNGISEERLLSLGEPFYSTKEKGTGLGLVVCKKIIERHNGKIEFQSELGSGTTVKIILPKIS